MKVSPLQRKIIAVGSGKGGVGKSTTSANLAVLAARKGLRVALVDLDPLSDLSVIFDLGAELMAAAKKTLSAASPSLSDHRIRMFPRLDLLFPHVKLLKGEPGKLRKLIFNQFNSELNKEYDLIIMDLPAGIGQEENLAFLPYLAHLVIVTNAEPTSHVSAGGYIKAAREINPRLTFFLWHNKFEPAVQAEFNPRTLWENYNRYVPEDLLLELEAKTAMRDIAFVPLDASLNLLHADAEYQHHLLGKFIEVLNLIDEQVVAELPPESEVPKPLRIIIRHHVLHMKKTNVEETQHYLASILGKPGFRLPLDQKIYLEKYLEVQNRHPVRARIDETRDAVNQYLDQLASDGSMFGVRTPRNGADRDRFRAHASAEIRKLLDLFARAQSPQNISRAPWPRKNAAMMRNLSGLLLFYFALYRLLEVKSVQGLISSFVPHRRLPDGRRVRSRYDQISLIIKEDATYHQQYFNLIKRLFPVILKQLGVIVQSRSWNELVYRDANKKAHHNAYLKLLGRTIHDTVNGGLGIHVGIRHNAAAMAIQQGGATLLAEIGAVTQD